MTTPSPAAAEYVTVASLRPWVKNPRKNDPAVAAVADSIKRFGFGSPIIARRENGEIIAGHTRLKAAIRLGLAEVPVRYLDLSEPEAHALALADNKVGELAEWDDAALADLLRDLTAADVSMDGLGFTTKEIDELIGAAPEPPSLSQKYTDKIKAPTYTPKGDRPPVDTLLDRAKADSLAEEVRAASLPPDVASFLIAAAERHTVFNFERIAEFYCHAPPETQALMERSALVIIDFNDAIAGGFVRLSERLGALADADFAAGVDDGSP
jgi:hypothetical protein